MLTSAWIIFDEEFIQSDPTATHTHHDSGAEDTNKTKFLRFTELETRTEEREGSALVKLFRDLNSVAVHAKLANPRSTENCCRQNGNNKRY